MEGETPGHNKYLILAIAAVLISTVYWSAYVFNAYNTYHEYTDIGTVVADMYYHVHYPGVVHGLEYLVFLNHLSPDLIAFIPTFALVPSALTLLVEQAFIVSLTALVVFFIARDLLKNEKIALLLAVAFLLNPGTMGIFVFDFHPELLLPLFFVLTFYFLFRRRMRWFLASLLLFLGSIEIAPFLAIGLGVTMAIYAVLRERDQAIRMSWLKYSAIVIVLAMVAFGLYWVAGHSLDNAYLAGSYDQLPNFMRFNIQSTTATLGSIGAALSNGALAAYFSSYSLYLIFALAIVFVGLGIAGLFDPLFAILFIGPWLAEVFIVGEFNFIFIWNQYFSYALGGSIVIALLALRDPGGSGMNNRLSLLGYREKAWKYIIASIPICAVLLFLVSPHFLYSKNINNLGQDLLFQISPTQKQQVQQLTSMVALIPQNASVMASFFTMPQLAARQYYEGIPGGYGQFTVAAPNSPYAGAMWFTPDYILADFNPAISLNAENGYQVQDFLNISGITIVNGAATFNGPYELYAYNGSAVLLKRK